MEPSVRDGQAVHNPYSITVPFLISNIRAVRSGIRSVPEIEPIHPKVKFLSLAEEMSLSQIVDILNFFLKTTNCDCPAED